MQLSQITFYSPDAPLNPADSATGKVSSATASIGSITLSDVIDTINPLEHIPFVSTLYDAITGSKPSAGAQIAGGALFGGPVGMIASAMNLAFEGETGHDIAGSVVAAVTGNSTTQVASNAAAPAQTADASTATAAYAEAANQAPVTTPNAEILPPLKSASGKLASVTNPVATQQSAQDVLALFDTPNAAAHSAYRRAQSLSVPSASTGTGLVM